MWLYATYKINYYYYYYCILGASPGNNCFHYVFITKNPSTFAHKRILLIMNGKLMSTFRTHFHNLFFLHDCYVVYCHFNMKVNMFNQYQSLGSSLKWNVEFNIVVYFMSCGSLKLFIFLFFLSNLSHKS